MMKDEYKLVPKKEITDLKKEVKELKKSIRNKTGVKTKSSISDKKLRESMDNLSESISELVNLFTVAKGMGENGAFDEFKTQSLPELKSLIEQNKAIAKGILAITQMLSEHLPKLVSIARGTPKYKLLRTKQKSQSNPMPSEPKTSSSSFLGSDLPSMPEVDDDFEFSKEKDNNSQQGY